MKKKQLKKIRRQKLLKKLNNVMKNSKSKEFGIVIRKYRLPREKRAMCSSLPCIHSTLAEHLLNN